MPIHDWTRVQAGIFQDFHHAWIEEIKRGLNNGILPSGYYAMAEQHAAGFGPDVLTLQGDDSNEVASVDDGTTAPTGGIALAPPKLRFTAESDLDFYRRKQNSVVIRHVSGDRVVAMIEVVSPGNKASRRALRSFLEKAAELLDRGIHLLVLDLLPLGPRDPNGIHAAIWEEISGETPGRPAKPLTLAAYESDLTVRAYVVPVAVGESLPEMPLFLQPRAQVPVPLDATYNSAFAAVPWRWRQVLESPS